MVWSTGFFGILASLTIWQQLQDLAPLVRGSANERERV